MPGAKQFGMRGIGIEVGAAVLQHHPGVRGDHDRAERFVEALDHAQDVAAPVGHHEAGGVAVDRAPPMVLRAARVEGAPPLLRVALAQQRLHRHPRVRRIGDPAVAVRVGQLGHLDQQVQMLGRVDLVAREIEALEQVERQQRGQALGGRRRLVHRVAAVGGRDRLAPLALVRGQVLRGEEAVARHAVRDRARHAPLVEELGLAAQLGERAREIGLAEAVAGLRELAAGHEDAMPLRIVGGGRLLADGLRDHVGEREALARVVDRRLEQRGQRAACRSDRAASASRASRPGPTPSPAPPRAPR